MEGACKEAADVVIDAGASSFRPLSDYLISMSAPAILAEHGRDVLVHSVIVGPPNTEDTMQGLQTLLDQVPSPAKFVVWLNDYFGPVGGDGFGFEETPLYQQHRSRIAAIVRLPRHGKFFAADIAAMMSKHQTYAEAIAGAFVMPAQRLAMVRRGIWDQLAAIPAMAAA